MIPWFAFFVLLVIPGRQGTWLDGIPLNQPVECIVLLILLLRLVLYVLTRYHAADPPSARIPASLDFISSRHTAVFGVLFLLKLFLWSTNVSSPPAFFSFCYQPLNASAETPCYISADNLTRFQGATYLDPTLKWDAQGNRENWYRNDAVYLHGGPFSVRITGGFNRPLSGSLKMVSAGRITGRIGEQTVTAASAGRQDTLLQLTPSSLSVPVNLTLTGDGGFFELQTERAGKWIPLRAARPSLTASVLGRAADALGWVIAVALLVWSGFVLLQILAHLPARYTLLLPLAFVPLLLHISWTWGYPILLGTCYVLALREKSRDGRVHILHWIVIIALSIAVSFHLISQLQSVQIRLPQDDPLTYETLGRHVYKMRSLEGGESVFFYQPGFRYYMTACLLLFGESNTLPYVLNVAGYLVLAWLLFLWLDNRLQPTFYSRSASLVILLLLAKIGTANALFNLTEFLAWSFLMIGVMAFFSNAQWRPSSGLRFGSEPLPAWAFPLFSIGLGYAAVIRPNQILGLGLLFTTALAAYAVDHRNEPGLVRRLALSTMLFGFVISLPLLHNLYYGHEWVLFSGGASQNKATYVFPPSQLLELPHSAAARHRLGYQLSHLLVLPNSLCLKMSRITTTAFNVTLLIFSVALVRAWKQRAGLMGPAALIIVLGFAVIHVFYQVDNYYPRHVIVIYLMMGIFSTILLSGRPQKRP